MRTPAILLTCALLSAGATLCGTACGTDQRAPSPDAPGDTGGDAEAGGGDAGGDAEASGDPGGVGGAADADAGQGGGDVAGAPDGDAQGGADDGGDDGQGGPPFCGAFEDRPDAAPDDDPPFDPDPPDCGGPCPARHRCVEPGECVNICQASLPCPVSAMRTITRSDDSTFRIDAYEASRPDAGETQPGCNQRGRACSQPDVHPWTDVTWTEARDACEKVGKRLCTMAEWQAACRSSCGFDYPYGDDFDGNACNGVGANPEGATLWETGRRAQCSTPDWVYDLVGNVREWTDTETEPGVYAIVGGSPRDQARSVLSCKGEDIKTEGADNAPQFVGFRCCSG